MNTGFESVKEIINRHYPNARIFIKKFRKKYGKMSEKQFKAWLNK